MTSLQSLLDRLVRLQRALGLWPLWVFAAFHMWVHWPALLGRDAWLARAQVYSPGALAGWTVVALIALYVALGVVRAARAWRLPASVETGQSSDTRDTSDTSGRAAARDVFQGITGACIALFVAYHISQVWPKPAGVHATLETTYQRLWEQLGRTGPLVLYVLGCGALALHLAVGAWRALEQRMALVSRVPKAWRMALGILVGVLGLWVFVSYLQLVARFATGVPLLS